MSQSVVEYILNLKDNLTPNIQNAETATNSLTASLGTLGTMIGVTFGAAAIGVFTKSMIDAGTLVEDTRVGLTTLTHDAAESNKIIQQTMEDAQKTPFNFKTLLQANQALLATGLNAEESRQIVLNLGNAISGAGKGNDEFERMIFNLQQIANNGKASGQDIRQFGMAGINVFKMLKMAGIQTGDGIQYSFDQIVFALQKAHDAGGMFDHAIENMSNNTSVRISNIGDAFFRLKVQMFDDLKPTIDSVSDSTIKFVGTLSSAWSWMVSNKDMLKEMTVVALGAVAAYRLLTMNISFYNIAMTLANAETALMNMLMNANPIGIVITALAGLAMGVVYAWNKFVGFRATIMGVWSTIKEFGSIVSDVFSGVWKQIHGVITFNPSEVAEGTVKMESAMFDAGKRMSNAYREGYDSTVAEDVKSKQKPAVKNDLKTKPPTSKDAPDLAPKTKTAATGSKNVTFNISINDIVKEFNVNVSNIKDSASKIKDQITGVLIESINDFQTTAR